VFSDKAETLALAVTSAVQIAPKQSAPRPAVIERMHAEPGL
jgi:hypothetical protein